jgi:putative membrane protein
MIVSSNSIINNKTMIMKKLSFVCLMAAGMFLISCGDNTNDNNVASNADTATSTTNNDATTMSDTVNRSSDNATSTSSLTDKDNQFVMKAASGGLMEVELGKLAQAKASNPKVKEFGSMMVTDHSKANDELKSLAQSKGITLPGTMTDEHQKHVKDLGEKTGDDFDEAYMKMMVDDHKEDVDHFEDCSKDSKDADLKAFATKTLPVLQKHLAQAKTIKDAVK